MLRDPDYAWVNEMKNTVRKAKRFIKVLLGKDFCARIDCSCPTERFGTGYGGWDIVAGLLDKNSIVYSFGIGEDASFDLSLINKFDLIIHAFDPTPQSIQWVISQKFPDNFIMHRVGLAGFNGDVPFNPPENSEHVSHTLLDRPATKNKAIILPVKRLSTIMNELGHNHIDILKMDIEGAEYGVINDIEKSAIRPIQILIEFHHRFPTIGIEKSKEAISKIRGMGYRLFSVSATGEEFSFIKTI